MWVQILFSQHTCILGQYFNVPWPSIYESNFRESIYLYVGSNSIFSNQHTCILGQYFNEPDPQYNESNFRES